MADSGAPPPAAREPHLLSLKVLRAARPSLKTSIVPYSEEASLGGTALRDLDANSVEKSGEAKFGLTEALLLPSTFGTVYLGYRALPF
jgi:hypothetical protein